MKSTTRKLLIGFAALLAFSYAMLLFCSCAGNSKPQAYATSAQLFHLSDKPFQPDSVFTIQDLIGFTSYNTDMIVVERSDGFRFLAISSQVSAIHREEPLYVGKRVKLFEISYRNWIMDSSGLAGGSYETVLMMR